MGTLPSSSWKPIVPANLCESQLESGFREADRRDLVSVPPGPAQQGRGPPRHPREFILFANKGVIRRKQEQELMNQGRWPCAEFMVRALFTMR